MKLTYPICCGVDVHKTFLVATIITSDFESPKYKQKRFSTFYRGLLEFKQWLLDNNCKDVCMESTGKYWVPVWNALEDSIHVVIANPKWVSAVKGNKCRFQNAFTVCNLTLDAVVSDMFGKSATDIENYLLESDSVDPNHCVSLLRGSLKKKSEEIINAVEGFDMTAEQKERARIIQGHFAAISLLCTIPGIDRRLAITIISEIGTDMSQFGSSKRLCNWAGLSPGRNQSAGKKKSVKISRAGVYLKPALVEAAHAAVKATAANPYFRIKYGRIMQRRGKKRAIIAIARMMLTSIFAMFSTGEVFNPRDILKFDMPEELKKKQTLSAAKDAVNLLVSLGLVAEDSISLQPLAS